MDKKRAKRNLIIFFVIAIVSFILAIIVPKGIPSFIANLIALVFSILTFIWSIIAIKNKNYAIGITFLIISALILLIWILGFISLLILPKS